MNEILEEEIWKDVIGYEGRYEVSNLGRVRSLHKSFYGKILSPSFERFGYPKVVLMKDAKCKTHKVHRLVATAFIPNPSNKPVVNHIDHNPKNPKASNLEWCTDLENVRHARNVGRPNGGYNVGQYDLKGELIKVWPSASEAEREGMFRAKSIREVISGNRNKTGGFAWRKIKPL